MNLFETFWPAKHFNTKSTSNGFTTFKFSGVAKRNFLGEEAKNMKFVDRLVILDISVLK